MGGLMTFYGKTDGANTTGVFSLYSEYLVTPVNYIKLDMGLIAKIWAYRVAGEPCVVLVEVSVDGGSTYNTVGAIDLSSSGHVSEEKRRPIRIEGIAEAKNALTYIRFRWSQSAPGESHIGIEIEFTEKDEED